MKLTNASKNVIRDLRNGPARIFALYSEVYGWKVLVDAGLVERFGNPVIGWARLTPKGEELAAKLFPRS